MCTLIETERLTLRPPELGDEVSLHRAINHSLTELQPWVVWANNPRLTTSLQFVESAVKQWASNKQSNFPMVIVHKEDGRIIGCAGFTEKSDPSVPLYEPGYWLDTRYTGRGLATEFTTALTRYAFEKLNAKRVQLSIQAKNTKSINVAKRCGFELEATLHNACLDIQTGEAADTALFVCFDTKNLPTQKVSWT